MNIKHREITDAILGCFYRVFNGLGSGLLEAPYALALEWELRQLGLQVGREVKVRLYYAGFELMQYRLDMLVEGCVVVEIKSGERLHPNAKRQLYNYLRATNLEVGLLLHFGPEPTFERVFCPNTKKPHAAVVKSEVSAGSGASE
jgi:GxxExxY protein